jgi:hypothetical protein
MGFLRNRGERRRAGRSNDRRARQKASSGDVAMATEQAGGSTA